MVVGVWVVVDVFKVIPLWLACAGHPANCWGVRGGVGWLLGMPEEQSPSVRAA